MKRRSGMVKKTSPPDLEGGEATEYEPPKTVKGRKKRDNVLKEYLTDYTSNSNLHGLKYIGAKETTISEKVFWVIICMGCALYCAKQIHITILKWNDGPDIVSFAEKSIPVWKIPYPAVTVCFETKAQQTKYNFTENFHLYNSVNKGNLTDDEQLDFEHISMVCDPHFSSGGTKFASGLNVFNKVIEVSPNLTDSFFGCKWNGINKYSCEDLFAPILTEDGLCYTFNRLGAEDVLRIHNLHTDYEYLQQGMYNYTTTWTLDNGYTDEAPIVTYPYRGSGYGAKAGLSFITKTSERDLDYLCRGPVQGLKILLHNPAELPTLSEQYFRVPLSQEVTVAVKPKMMTTSDGLKLYKPEMRQCYFSWERYLRYFRVYTQANCDTECLSNYTYARCGCVHFGMLYDSNMAVCGAGSVQCLQAAQRELLTVAVKNSLNRGDGNRSEAIDENARDVALRCACLPACTAIEYEAEMSQADFDWRALFHRFKVEIPPELNDTYMSRVMIFFKEAQFIRSRRSEMYGSTDLLASTGGILGLFLGFSVLSVVEIIYFLSLRIICRCWRKKTPTAN